MIDLVGPSWASALKDDHIEDQLRHIAKRVRDARKRGPVYPESANVFRAFHLTPFDQVKVVILGQDPYHTPGKADGLAFSSPNLPIPPSLHNIFAEIRRDVGPPDYTHGPDLSDWAGQGVFLLNTILTVDRGTPASHKDLGWQTFTSKVIATVADKSEPCVILLWGSKAMLYANLFKNRNQHLVLSTTHPSPYSAHMGFLGSGHFSRTNEFLKSVGRQPIVW